MRISIGRTETGCLIPERMRQLHSSSREEWAGPAARTRQGLAGRSEVNCGPYAGLMGAEEVFDSGLLQRLRSVVRDGDTVATLDQGRPNLIGRIGEDRIEVTTAHSAETVGGARLVPAWMFNDVWVELRQKGRVNRDEVDRQRTRRNVKRSSIVFALLERLPEVEVEGRRPLVLRLR